MATSVATLKYGTYQFNPVPQIGRRWSGQPLGNESKSGPFSREVVVTLVGYLRGISLNDIETKVAALEAAIAKQNQVLYYHDGTTLRINIAAQPLTIDIPSAWNQYLVRYSLTFVYVPLDDVNPAPFAVSYNGFTFDPIPIIGREINPERESVDSVRDIDRVQVSLSGFIEEGSVAANLARLALLETALEDDNGTLVYAGFSQQVKIGRWSHSPDTLQRRVAYSVSFSYERNATIANVKKMSSSRSIQSGQRIAKHYVPFLDDASVQFLGREGQTITATGFVIATSMAAARTAALDEIDAQFPINGFDESRTITEKDSENRVEWNVRYFYPTPQLVGGVYGTYT